MSENRLFTAFYTKGTVINNVKDERELKIQLGKIKNFSIDKIKEIKKGIYSTRFRQSNLLIQTFYFANDSLLFIEICELYHQFLDQLVPTVGHIHNFNIDVFLPNLSTETVTREFLKAIEIWKKNGDEEQSALCHIFGQKMWHDNAYIVGNVNGLREMRDAIDIALKYGEARTTLLPSDREAYYLYIRCLEDENTNELNKLQLPYHDQTIYEPDNKKEISPQETFHKYRSLMGNS